MLFFTGKTQNFNILLVVIIEFLPFDFSLKLNVISSCPSSSQTDAKDFLQLLFGESREL